MAEEEKQTLVEDPAEWQLFSRKTFSQQRLHSAFLRNYVEASGRARRSFLQSMKEVSQEEINLTNRPTRCMDPRWLNPPQEYKGLTPPNLAVSLRHSDCPNFQKRFLGLPDPDDQVPEFYVPFFKFMVTDEEQLKIRADIIREGNEAKARKFAMMTDEEKEAELEKEAKEKKKKCVARRRARKEAKKGEGEE